MANYIINLIDAQRFEATCCKACDHLSNAQNTIDKSYNQTSQNWKDNVSVYTGNTIKETALKIRAIHQVLSDTVKKMDETITILCQYNNTNKTTRMKVDPFRISISEVNIMSDNIKTNSEELEAFYNKLTAYIDNIAEITNALNKAYQEVGNSWKDEQYRKFGEELKTFTQNMKIQIQKLNKARAYVKKKIEILKQIN